MYSSGNITKALPYGSVAECVIFNDDIHAESRGAARRTSAPLKHGKPMIFGKNHELGLIKEGVRFKVVRIGENGIREQDILVHDAVNHLDTRHYMLVRMALPEYPIAMGVSFLLRYMKMLVTDCFNPVKIENLTMDDLLTGNTFKLD
jgi:hypothetical protein